MNIELIETTRIECKPESFAAWVWSFKASAENKLVLLAMAEFYEEGVGWPSIDTISEKTGLDHRAVEWAILWAITSGLLRLHRGKP